MVILACSGWGLFFATVIYHYAHQFEEKNPALKCHSCDNELVMIREIPADDDAVMIPDGATHRCCNFHCDYYYYRIADYGKPIVVTDELA